MAYTEATREHRRCTATRTDGTPFRGYAAWGDPGRRCGGHGGRSTGRPSCQLDLLVVLFQGQGYRVLLAGDGLAALAVVGGDRYRDARPRRLGPRPASAGTAGSDPGGAHQRGGSDPRLPGVPLITKPFDPQPLVAFVARVLSSVEG